MRVNDKQVVLNIFKAIEYAETSDDYFAVNVNEQAVTEVRERSQFLDPLEYILTSKDLEEEEDEDLAVLMAWLDIQQSRSSIRCKAVRALAYSRAKDNLSIYYQSFGVGFKALAKAPQVCISCTTQCFTCDYFCNTHIFAGREIIENLKEP